MELGRRDSTTIWRTWSIAVLFDAEDGAEESVLGARAAVYRGAAILIWRRGWSGGIHSWSLGCHVYGSSRTIFGAEPAAEDVAEESILGARAAVYRGAAVLFGAEEAADENGRRRRRRRRKGADFTEEI